MAENTQTSTVAEKVLPAAPVSPPPAYVEQTHNEDAVAPVAVAQQGTGTTMEGTCIRPSDSQSSPATVTRPPPTQQPMKPLPEEPKDASSAQVHVTPLPQLTTTPAWIDCPHCYQRTKTLVTSEGSSAQCLSAAVCCLCCGIITVCIPFLCHWFEDTTIQCSGCKQRVAFIPHDGPLQVNWPGPPHQYQQQAPPQGASKIVPSQGSPADNQPAKFQ